MSEFIEFAPLTKQNQKVPLDGVTIHMQNLKTTKNLVFCFGDTLLDKLGWEKDDQIKLLWGTGSSKNKLKIAHASKLGWILRKGKKATYSRVFVSNFPDHFTSEKIDQTKLHHQLFEGVERQAGYLILTLPQDMVAG